MNDPRPTFEEWVASPEGVAALKAASDELDAFIARAALSEAGLSPADQPEAET